MRLGGSDAVNCEECKDQVLELIEREAFDPEAFEKHSPSVRNAVKSSTK